MHAAVKLPALVSDHMVLQQGVPVRIWGTADPGETVRLEFQGQAVSTRATENGKWVAWLKPLAVAGPLERPGERTGGRTLRLVRRPGVQSDEPQRVARGPFRSDGEKYPK